MYLRHHDIQDSGDGTSRCYECGIWVPTMWCNEKGHKLDTGLGACKTQRWILDKARNTYAA